MTSIRLNNVSKSWGSVEALKGISFEVAPGNFTVLLGPSGCGKSTLIRIVAGLETVSGGEIFIGDRNVTACAPAERNISMVFQSYALFPHLNVAENILFGLKVRKATPAKQKEGLDRVATMLGLTPYLARKPSKLSGGQQQRVAMARAIISEAPICLMDEPMSNLDAQLRNEMRMEIQGLQKELGITMLYVTHDQIEAMTMADQIVLLNGGRTEQIGHPTELYGAPCSQFAARFIGTPPMNVFPAGDLTRGALSRSFRPDLVARPDLLMGVRPEDIYLGEDGVEAKLVNVEYLGADKILHCELDGSRILVRTSRETSPSIGSTLRLVWKNEDVHLFSKETQQKIN
ncbi:ABC transporter ATP-binding protein [Pararhizobium sp. O133]|uniref:ABC transporter ATP-binding protein n=1 Tax=Pararhizobium sp. O133 TaxID=3449278 RepID=UPI003F6879B3